jgi:hypothetical protein
VYDAKKVDPAWIVNSFSRDVGGVDRAAGWGVETGLPGIFGAGINIWEWLELDILN